MSTSPAAAIAADEAQDRGVTTAQVMKEKGLLPLVLVRTIGAGVHVGLLARRDGMDVDLLDARRLWRWRGANTLNEVALHGVDMKSHTRLSEPVLSLSLPTAIEVIEVSESARASLTTSQWLD